MQIESTCYKDSAGKVSELVLSFDTAEERCRNEGGRLLHIRSIEALNHLFKSRAGHFGADGYMEYKPNTVVAIGSKYIQEDSDSERKFYYK